MLPLARHNNAVFGSLLASIGFILLVTSVICSKENLFKINKLNLIWNKAQHSLGSGKLKDLKGDLARHDVDEVNLKKMKAHNQDKDGLQEAAIRRRLLTILAKYNLERYYDDLHPPLEEELHLSKKQNLQSADSVDSHKLAAFRDKKLDKLWKKAEKAGFSPEELMILHEEFQHQQDKLDEHYETMSNINDKLDKKAKDNNWENSIESTLEDELKWTQPKENPADKKKRLDVNIHQDLKKQYIEIKNGIHQLHHKVVSRKITPGDDGFQETSTKQLWAAALDSNFTLDELDSLKEELRHYEVRIKKLKHFENQLERTHFASKGSPEEDDDEVKHIKRKVKELKFKVARTHETIEQKISTPRQDHYREDL